VSSRGAIGTSLPRLEDAPLLRGTARFIDDIRPADVLHVALVRSPLAHATIRSVDAGETGAIAAFTGRDLDGWCSPMKVHLTTPGVAVPEWPVIARDRVRYVGDIIAAVVARSRYHAEDASELVSVDLDPLPVVNTVEDAMAEDAPLIHDSVPRNRYHQVHRAWGDAEAAFANAHVVVEGEVVHPRVSGAPMEGRGVVAAPDGAGGVVVHTSTQAPHAVRDAIAECLGLPLERVRVIASDVGGGFGLKAHVYVEEILLGAIAHRLQRAVKWVEDRSEHLQSANHARDQRITFSAAVRRDGRVLGLRAQVFSNIGAYAIRPHGPLLDPLTCAGLITGPYDIQDYEYDSYALVTNRCPEGPYRGVGMVTAVLAHERLMDLVARRLRRDPAEVRRANLVRPDQMPYTTPTGHPYESGDYAAALDRALAVFDYRRARADQQKARDAGRLYGIGIGSYVEFTGAGSSTFVGRGMVGIPGTDAARVWVEGDGEVHVQTTCPAIGQGVQTTFAQIAADALGVEAASVVVEQTDTGRVQEGTGSFQSRSSVVAATAAHRAATQLRGEILEAAAWRLDQPPERLDIRELVLADLLDPETNGGHHLDVSVSYDPKQASHPYATHVCAVEVDRGSGAVEVKRYVIAEDCGTIINPAIVDGQVAGGVAQGAGAVLLEQISYGADGQLLSGSFMDYLLPTSTEAPQVEISHLVTPSTVHELGTKGIGEGGTIGSTAALANAVADAVGARNTKLPWTPERVLAAISDASRAAERNRRRAPRARPAPPR
jgi:aerobic carbon-monoxide dehydrogenase large subunit